MVVVSGEIDAERAVALGSELRKLQRECDVVVDVWDVTEIDEVGVFALSAAKRRANAAGWGFAVVADATGPVAEAIEIAGATDTLKPYTSRKRAREALHLASS
jgi:anti-anti-sigma regulatory factor